MVIVDGAAKVEKRKFADFSFFSKFHLKIKLFLLEVPKILISLQITLHTKALFIWAA